MSSIVCAIAFILFLVSCTDVTPNVSTLSRSISKAKIENNYLVFDTNFLPKNKDLSISDINNNRYDLRLVKSDGSKRYYEATTPGLVIKLATLYSLTVKDTQAQSVIPIQFEGASGGVPTYLKLQTSQTSLSYQGLLTNTDGTALTYNNVSLIFQITDPAGTCILYREQVDGIDMTASNGFVDVPLGQGTGQYPGTGSILEFFNNSNSYTCDGGGAYSPVVDDIRKLHVTYYDGVSWKAISPDRTFRVIPYAGYALSAQKLGGNLASDFLLKAGLPTCGAGTFLTWNGTALACGAVAGAGGGTLTDVTSSNSYLSVATGTSTPVLTVNVGVVAGTLAAGNDPRLIGALQTGAAAGGSLAGTYPNPTLANNSVVTANITDGSITTAKLFSNPGINRVVATDSTTGAALSKMECSTVGDVLSWTVATGFQCHSISSLYTAPVSSVANKIGAVTLVSADISDASSANAAATIVRRDASGNFSAGTINGSGLVINTLQVTGGSPAAGKVLTSDAGGNATWASPVGSSPWTTSGSDIYYNSGNVGIGTMAPASSLVVKGSGVTGATSSLNVTDSTGASKLFVSDEGKIGIGTSNPSAFLELVQTSTLTAGSIYGGNISLITNPGVGSTANLYGISGNITQIGGNGGSSLTGVQGSVIQNSTGTTTNASGVQGIVTGYSGIISNAYGGKFQVANAGGTITNGTGVFIGNITATTKYSLYASDNTAPSYFAGSVGVGTATFGNSRLVIKGSTNTSAASGLNVTDSNGNSKLFVRNDGNVGLGSSSPGDLLTVFKNGSSNLTMATTSGPTNQAMLNFATNSVTGEAFGAGFNGKGWQIYANSSGYTNSSGGAEDLGFVFFDGASWNEAIHFKNDGHVGIGTLSPTYKLDVAGDINTSTCFRIGATSVSGTCTSDARLKENIQDYNQGLSEILGIRLRTYQFNGLGEMPKTGETAIGVIAQEVEQTSPDLVKSRMVRMRPEDKELTEIKVVDYSKFSYMLINAVKELYGKLLKVIDQQASQDREIASLKTENAQLNKEYAEMKARLERIEKLLESK